MKKKLSPAPIARTDAAQVRGLERAAERGSRLPTAAALQAALVGALLVAGSLGSVACGVTSKGGDDLGISADHGRKPALSATSAATNADGNGSPAPGTSAPIDPVATISVKGEAPAVLPHPPASVIAAATVAPIAPTTHGPKMAGKMAPTHATTVKPTPVPVPLGGKPSGVIPTGPTGSAPCDHPGTETF